jgi:transposase
VINTSAVRAAREDAPMEYIAFDSHKRYTQVRVEKADGTGVREARIEHRRGAIREFLRTVEPGSPVAVETIGNWYWIVDEIEAAGCRPRLVNAWKAKMMMATRTKTDKLDAAGLNRLQRAGTLPVVWIPPGKLRDLRELPRTRMTLVRIQTKLKNRIHSVLSKYGLDVWEVSDLFGVKGRRLIRERAALLPAETRFGLEELLGQLDQVMERVRRLEKRMAEVFSDNPDLQRLRTLPGVGAILGTVIWLEIGDVSRFATQENLASYSGTTPSVHSSGGKTRYGSLRSDVNHYLKWAFIEAANVVTLHARTWAHSHAFGLYQRLRKAKGHGKAIGAVARHLAEAAYWVLFKQENYLDPNLKSLSSTGA